MKWTLAALLAAALGGTTLGNAARAQPAYLQLADNLFTRIEDAFGPPQTPHTSVARIAAPEGDSVIAFGSGTLIDVNDQHGLVITNWHVVEGARGTITVTFPDGFRSSAAVLQTDEDWDLAALLIERPRAAPVPLAQRAPRPGDALKIAGYGSGKYREAAGTCTQYVAPSTQHPFEMIELDAVARQGDSGGPIFNEQGELAGVLFGSGGGRTSGSYCGRVHWFLAKLAPRGAALPMLAGKNQAAPSQPVAARSSATSAVRNLDLGHYGAPAAIHRAAADEEDSPLLDMYGHEPATTVEPPLVAMNEAPRAASKDTPIETASWRAANDPPSSGGFGRPGSSPSDVSVAEDQNGPISDTAWDQLRNALAVVGLLALILHGWHWLKTAG